MESNVMIINVSGVGPRHSKTLHEAARFFAGQLLHKRTVDKLEIDIEVERNLDAEGECVSEDDHKNPRYFTIRLNRASIEEMIKVLGHEMVHVKQYAKNELGKELTMSRGGKGVYIATRWQGEFWKPKGKEDAYWDAPWEIEAYGREVGLYQKWLGRND
jgi:hypothetical protein